MADKEKKGFLGEIKNQIIATIGVIITAVGGIVVTNIETWFAPKSESDNVIKEVVVDSVKTQQPNIIINIPNQETPKERVIIKEVPVKEEKKKEDVDW